MYSKDDQDSVQQIGVYPQEKQKNTHALDEYNVYQPKLPENERKVGIKSGMLSDNKTRGILALSTVLLLILTLVASVIMQSPAVFGSGTIISFVVYPVYRYYFGKR